jgi:glycosyltransferase involved in cell wall biosynthesis
LTENTCGIRSDFLRTGRPFFDIIMRVAILTTDLRESFKNYDRPDPCMGIAPEALLQGFAKLTGVEVHVISCLQKPVSTPETLTGNIRYHSLHVTKNGWLRTFYQGCIRAVRKKLREIQPDIVHGQGTERDCAISAAFAGFPNVVTVHGNVKAIADFYRSRPGSFFWLAARLETFALWKTGGVFCNSAYTERLVAPVARRIWRVPNCLRREFFDPPTVTSRSVPPILLNVGLLSPYKRQAEILTLAHRLWQRGLRFELQFAGSTETRTSYGADFMRRLSEAEKAGYARHLGSLPAGELVATFDRASALIHFPTEESFGLVVAEALARNVKLFAASVGGIVDIANGVEGAELFPAQDWPGLENAIARWLETGCPRPGAASETMRMRYAPETVARRHQEIYHEVLKQRR